MHKESDPEPELIRAYCNFYHFVPELGSVVWEVDGSEVPDEQLYDVLFPGAIILENTREDIVFTVKHAGTKEQLVSQLFEMEQDKYYNIIVCGPKEDPSLLIREIDIIHPMSGKVKFQFFHFKDRLGQT